MAVRSLMVTQAAIEAAVTETASVAATHTGRIAGLRLGSWVAGKMFSAPISIPWQAALMNFGSAIMS